MGDSSHPLALPSPHPHPTTLLTNCAKCTEQDLGRSFTSDKMPEPRHKLRPWQWRRRHRPSGMYSDWARVSGKLKKKKKNPQPQSPVESSSQQDDRLRKADPGRNGNLILQRGPVSQPGPPCGGPTLQCHCVVLLATYLTWCTRVRLNRASR